jgi:DNA gyrase inhibitor GyrI
MAIMIKEIPKMKVVCFEGFEPEPEKKASDPMMQWLKKNRLDARSQRIFGHNIDSDGKLSLEPHNAGYKFMVVVDDDFRPDPDCTIEHIEPGRFIVMGIEGNIEVDGTWIMEGWSALNAIVRDGAYTMKVPPRWYEVEVAPIQQGNVRLELFLEIE